MTLKTEESIISLPISCIENKQRKRILKLVKKKLDCSLHNHNKEGLLSLSLLTMSAKTLVISITTKRRYPFKKVTTSIPCQITSDFSTDQVNFWNKYNIIENNFERVRLEAAAKKQTLTIVSKINGWLTVDPVDMNRREAFEKRKLSNIR